MLTVNVNVTKVLKKFLRVISQFNSQHIRSTIDDARCLIGCPRHFEPQMSGRTTRLSFKMVCLSSTNQPDRCRTVLFRTNHWLNKFTPDFRPLPARCLHRLSWHSRSNHIPAPARWYNTVAPRERLFPLPTYHSTYQQIRLVRAPSDQHIAR